MEIFDHGRIRAAEARGRQCSVDRGQILRKGESRRWIHVRKTFTKLHPRRRLHPLDTFDLTLEPVVSHNRPIGTEALQPIVDNSRMIQLKTEQRSASVNTSSNLHRHNCPHGASKEELAAQASLDRGSPCTLVPLLWLSVLFGDRSKRYRFRLIVSPLPHS